MNEKTKNYWWFTLLLVNILFTGPLLAQGPLPPGNPIIVTPAKTNPYQGEKFVVTWIPSNPVGRFDYIGVFRTDTPDRLVWRVATYPWDYAARAGYKTEFVINEPGEFEIRYMRLDVLVRDTYDTLARSVPITVLPLPNADIITVSRTNINIGDSMKATWITTTRLTGNHYIGVYPTNAPLSHAGWIALDWVNASRWFRAQEQTFTLENPGVYEVRLVLWNQRAQTTETIARSESVTVADPVPDPNDITNFGSAGSGPVIAFGDSVTEGVGYGASNTNHTYPSALTRWTLGIPVINMGRGGETTAQGLQRLPEVLGLNPSIVILGHGGYDFLARIPSETTFANLDAMIAMVHDSGAIAILLEIQGGRYLDNFHERYEELRVRHGCALIPNILRGIIGDGRKMASTFDPHPNDWGNDIIAERIAPTLLVLSGARGPGPGPGPALTGVRRHGPVPVEALPELIQVRLLNGNILVSARGGTGSYILWGSNDLEDWQPIVRLTGNKPSHEIEMEENPVFFFKLTHADGLSQ